MAPSNQLHRGYCRLMSTPSSRCPSCRHMLLLFLTMLLLLVTTARARFAGESPLDSAEPAFEGPFLPVASRQFVGIRTLHPSQAVFGVRQLKERLAEQHKAEQRREQRQATPPMEEEEELEQQHSVELQQRRRRQRVYDRLLCMQSLQSLAQCKDI